MDIFVVSLLFDFCFREIKRSLAANFMSSMIFGMVLLRGGFDKNGKFSNYRGQSFGTPRVSNDGKVYAGSEHELFCIKYF